MRLERACPTSVVLLASVLCIVACCGNGNGNGDDENGDVVQPQTAKGYALTIGLNSVDPNHYGGWSGDLNGCEPDAKAMKKITEAEGLQTTMLLTSQATQQAVLGKLAGYASTLKKGDLLVVSYSGHGGSIPDQNGDETDDGLDETWVLYDGQLIDDELAQAWSKFADGVCIFLLSDSCHSGTVFKCVKADFENPPPERVEALRRMWEERAEPEVRDRAALLSDGRMTGLRGPDGSADPIKARIMPIQTALTTYKNNKADYDARGKAVPPESRAVILATVILISGCRDDQYSMDIGFNGLFTSKLMQVWNGGAFQGDHKQFQQQINAAVTANTPTQEPQYGVTGKPNPNFEGTRPFTVP